MDSVNTSYTTVVGLEIHAELLTRTKIFCGCPNAFGGAENENVCPGCLGLPGTLPALNRAAVDQAIRAGLALGCEISRLTSWDRKSYFYADLPNGYQITQMYAPICTGGGLKAGDRFVRLNHIHLEEDAGKLIHDGARNTTRIDFNRAGVPLIEIVTEPDMRSAGEAVAFVENVRMALLYAGVCDGKMEQGSLRVDANVSVMPEGAREFGTRVEIKNINSFRNVALAIEYEANRQMQTLAGGGAIRQETRRFSDVSGTTSAMREKEDAPDYRYCPDPDIPPLHISETYIESLRASLGEPPESRKARYVGEYGMAASDADTILARKIVSDFLDATVALGAEPKDALGVVRGEILRNIGDYGVERIGVAPGDVVRLLRMAKAGEISANNMKKAIGILMRGGDRGADRKTVSGGDDIASGSGVLSSAGDRGGALSGAGDRSGVSSGASDRGGVFSGVGSGSDALSGAGNGSGVFSGAGGRSGAHADAISEGDVPALSLDEILSDYNMLIREDPEKLASAVRDVLAANPAAVRSFKDGETKVFGFFMGQCNKTLRGSVQPATLEKEIRAQLDKLP